MSQFYFELPYFFVIGVSEKKVKNIEKTHPLR